MHKPSITAHAGALGTAPNTLDSIQAILAFGVGILEVDVRFLPGGVPALGHDSVTPRSPALETVFALLRGYETRINLDMKETFHVANVAELVIQYGLQDRAFLTGIGEGRVPSVRDCGLPYYLNSADTAAAWALDALGPNISYRQCTEELVRAAHRQNLLVSVWTVDNPAAMRKMLRMGVDNITTRRPDTLQRILCHDH